MEFYFASSIFPSVKNFNKSFEDWRFFAKSKKEGYRYIQPISGSLSLKGRHWIMSSWKNGIQLNHYGERYQTLYREEKGLWADWIMHVNGIATLIFCPGLCITVSGIITENKSQFPLFPLVFVNQFAFNLMRLTIYRLNCI